MITRAGRRGLAMSAITVVLIIGGCGGGDGPAAERSDAPNKAPATDAGVSADEARSRGAFFADYDARFEDQRAATGDGESILVLTNVGNAEDTYQFTVDPTSGGSVSPTSTSLASGRSTRITVRHVGRIEVRVNSEGRGAEIATRMIG